MFSDIFNLLINTVGTLYLTIILMRFVLQLAKADFYNPISQFVVKATNPLLIPLRKFIPGFGGIDVASLVLAVLFQTLLIVLQVLLVQQGSISNPFGVLVVALAMALGLLIKIYFWSLIIMIVASWIAPGSAHPALLLINQITEPVMKPFRSILPSMGGLDLSPILAFLTLQILEIVLNNLVRMLV